MKLVTIIGARPQIIKAAAISRAISNFYTAFVEEVIVHTGQHYDENMSDVFFSELNIPLPKYNLNIGSSGHGTQTAKMIEGIEEILLKELPDYVIVYGDTNSTIAASIAASKIHFPIVHIEAGLRSYNKKMPEEINRVVCDHVSTFLFTPTSQGFKNLLEEGFRETQPPYSINNPGIFHSGDIMYDNSLYFSKLADEKSKILQNTNLNSGEYILSTIHRNDNTDNIERLESIFEAFFEIIEKHNVKIVLPLHPRTTNILKKQNSIQLYNRISNEKNIIIIPPASFLDMIMLEKNAKLIMTDSGGVQKESHFFKKPCVILRPETEWVELVDNGTAAIADADKNKIVESFENYFSMNNQQYPDFYGDGQAAKTIIGILLKQK